MHPSIRLSRFFNSAFALLVSLIAGSALAQTPATAPSAEPAKVVRVVVWDERQPQQKQAYENFLGNAIADDLRKHPEFDVKSVALDDPEQGLTDDTLDHCDVLVWWGHIRNAAVTASTGRRVLERIKSGRLSLIALHSAHWSAPFVEAMRYRATEDALKSISDLLPNETDITYVVPPRFVAPKRGDPITPSVKRETLADGKVHIEMTLPNCVFPAYRADGKPSHVTTLLPDHPIAQGIPATWDVKQTEMYDEPFNVPTPDAVIFEEKWDLGEHFRSGCFWNIGKGKVFYFRPGHEIFPVYKDPIPLRVIENACRWLGVEHS